MKQTIYHLIRWLYLFKPNLVYGQIFKRSHSGGSVVSNNLVFKTVDKLKLTIMLIIVLCVGFEINAQSPSCLGSTLETSIDNDDSVRISLRELVPNLVDAMPISLTIHNSFDQPVYEGDMLDTSTRITLSACNLTSRTFTFQPSNDMTGMACMGTFTIPEANSYSVNVSDTSFWCLSPQISVPPKDALCDLAYYNADAPPYTINPTLTGICGNDIYLESLYDYNLDGVSDAIDARDYYCDAYARVGLSINGDWPKLNSCGDSDTAYTITRQYILKGKSGRVPIDQIIAVYRLPELEANNFLAPENDTLFCALEERSCSSISTAYPWAQAVGLHLEATDPTVSLFYPKSQTDEASTQGSSAVLIRRTDGTELTAAEIDDLPTMDYNGVMSYVVEVVRGDQVYVMNSSGNLEYETVGDSWFLQAVVNPTWVALVIISIERRMEVCDIWDDERTCFDGIRLIIPESPLDPTGDCDTLCLTDGSFCGTEVKSTRTNMGLGCEGFHRVVTTITQDSCFSENSSTTCVSNIGGNIMISGTGFDREIIITQNIYKVDTLAPIFVFDSDCSDVPMDSVITRQVDAHNCIAEVFVPCIELKDACRGVQEVKVCIVDETTRAVQSDGIIRNLTRGSDNSWCHTGNPFSIPSGTYNVRYKWSDSCSNMDSIDWFRLVVIDETAPVITMTNGRLYGAACDDTIWYEPNGLIASIQENCFICDTLYRRTDWETAFGIDLCLPSMSSVTTQAALESYLDSLDAVFSGNEVEEYYLEQYNWIVNDRHCSDVVQQKLIETWRQGLLTYWNNNCLNSPISLTTTSNFGAGWTQEVPISTVDACGDPIGIEVLVIDNSGNCGTASNFVDVQTDPTDTCSCLPTSNFTEINLTCAAYTGLGYQAALTAAQANNTAALDALLGVPKRVSSLTGVRLSSDSLSYFNRDATDVDPTADVDVDWDTTTNRAQLGLYVSPCNLTFTQSIDMVPSQTDICNTRVITITRTFSNVENVSCGISAGEITITQTIVVEPEKIIAYLVKDDFDTTCFNMPSDLRRTILANPVELISEGNRSLQIDDILQSTTLDFATGGCISYSTSFEDEFRDYIIESTGTSSPDTIGVRYYRIYKPSEDCTDNSTFPFFPDTTILVVTFNQIGSETCMNFDGSTTSRSALLSGSTMSAFNTSASIADVEIMAERDGQMISSTMSDEVGHFELTLPEGEAIKVRASKNINAAEGIDVGDILSIQLHMRGLRTIDDAYKKIAADVNADGLINGKDIIEMRRVVLGKQSSFSNNESWYLFNENTGEKTTHLEFVEDKAELNYMGVKIGDVDTDNDPISRTSDRITFEGQSNHLFSGDQSQVEFRTNDDLMAYQFGLRYDPTKLSIVGIEGIGEEHWHMMEEGYIRLNYHGPNAESFKLVVKAYSDINLSEELSIEVGDYSSFAVDRNYGTLPIELGFKEENFSDQFTLFWSYPNPAKESAFIPFKLAQDSDVELRFFDAAGKLLKIHRAQYPAGTNKYEVFTNELGATGVVYYQMNTGDFVATKRMIILN